MFDKTFVFTHVFGKLDGSAFYVNGNVLDTVVAEFFFDTAFELVDNILGIFVLVQIDGDKKVVRKLLYLKLPDSIIDGDNPAAEELRKNMLGFAINRGKEEHIIVPSQDLLYRSEVASTGAFLPEENEIVHLIANQGLNPVEKIGHYHG